MSKALRQVFLRSMTHSSSIRNFVVTLPFSTGARQGTSRSHFRSRLVGYAGGALIVGGYYAANVERAPETGRLRFMALSKNEEEFYRLVILKKRFEMYKGKILPIDHPTTQLVRHITQRLLVSSNLGRLEGQHPPLDDVWNSSRSPPGSAPPDTKWIVLVVDDTSEVEADSALGIVRVATGILSAASTEEDLAAIIAHEIGHSVLRHGIEDLSPLKLPFVLYISAMFSIPTAWPRGADQAFLQRLTLASSQTREREADAISMQLLARAGYDPAAAPRTINNVITVAETRYGPVPPVLKWPLRVTHPPRAERIAHMNSLLPQASELYDGNDVANGKPPGWRTTGATVENSVEKVGS